jgi:hypothetical protein
MSLESLAHGLGCRAASDHPSSSSSSRELAQPIARGRRRDSAENASEFERVMLDNPSADVRIADDRVVVTLMAEGETPEWLFGPLMAR